MYERFDKNGPGHRTKGTESAGIKVRTSASEGYQQVRSSRSYPAKGNGVKPSTYETKEQGTTFAKGGGNKMVTASYPNAGPESWPGTKAPFTLPAPRTTKPKSF